MDILLGTCQECESGKVWEHTYDDTFVIYGKGPMIIRGLLCGVCDTCGADPVSTEQIKHNENILNECRAKNT